MTKPTKWYVRQLKTQISLGIRPVWSESSLSAWWKLGSLATQWTHSEDCDKTGRMPRLISVFAERTFCFVGFVMRRLIWGSNTNHAIFGWFEDVTKIKILDMSWFVLRKLILQTRMRSYPVGLGVWYFVGPFVYFLASCVRTVKALERLQGCTGSPEPSLVAYVINTIISWAGSNIHTFKFIQFAGFLSSNTKRIPFDLNQTSF